MDRRIVICTGVTLGLATAPALAQLAPHGPVLIEFDGLHQLAAEASRVGMLSQKLTFTLDINAEGKPTGCTISRKFRRKAVEIALCRPLLKYHRFQPARDPDGNAIAGKYNGTINFQMFFNQDGGSEARKW